MAETSPDSQKFVCIGQILSAHGVHGRVKVRAFTETLETITRFETLYDEKGRIVPLIFHKPHTEDVILAEIEGLRQREKAQVYNGTKLYVPRDALPEMTTPGSFYHADLIGLEVRDGSGQVLGEVKAVHNFGAGDILEVKQVDGREEMYLFNDETFPEVNIAGGYVQIVPPEALMVQDNTGAKDA
ncbi:MAG: 16S rRNA processing protein RimM [Hyphomicrobiales bacterium]|nr:16S rRNA processing protein RimM [Hyphomicrobiales bacterium]